MDDKDLIIWAAHDMGIDIEEAQEIYSCVLEDVRDVYDL